MSQPVEALLTVRQVAERLSLSTATIYKLVTRNELAALRVGESIRFRPVDLEQYLSRSTTTKGAP